MKTERGTGELVILLFALTIAVVIVTTMIGVVFTEIFNPEVDSSQIVAIISDILTTLLGVVAGFLAGRQEPAPLLHKLDE